MYNVFTNMKPAFLVAINHELLEINVPTRLNGLTKHLWGGHKFPYPLLAYALVHVQSNGLHAVTGKVIPLCN